MDSKVLEIVNHLVILIIYGIVLSRAISNQSLDFINTLMTMGGIIFSVLLMFFIWHLKGSSILE